MKNFIYLKWKKIEQMQWLKLILDSKKIQKSIRKYIYISEQQLYVKIEMYKLILNPITNIIEIQIF